LSGDCGFQRGKVILAGQATPSEPTESTDDVRRLRHALIREELEEYWCARDIVEIADAIGDMLYVVLGAAVSHGLDIEPIFEEIHRSNMTKFIDGHRAENGKWIKGPSYSPANLGPIIDRMRQ
jgi:NTP pyrophosphatase (non-canonical NTP hydrolase)